jgi:hypothetical protein
MGRVMGRGSVVTFPAAKTPREVDASGASLKAVRQATGLLSQLWLWIQAKKLERTKLRRLQVVETVSLGEKRFVAVVQVDSMQFLIGGGPTAVSLLAQLNSAETFGEVLKKTGVARKPAARRTNTKKQTAVDA